MTDWITVKDTMRCGLPLSKLGPLARKGTIAFTFDPKNPSKVLYKKSDVLHQVALWKERSLPLAVRHRRRIEELKAQGWLERKEVIKLGLTYSEIINARKKDCIRLMDHPFVSKCKLYFKEDVLKEIEVQQELKEANRDKFGEDLVEVFNQYKLSSTLKEGIQAKCSGRNYRM